MATTVLISQKTFSKEIKQLIQEIVILMAITCKPFGKLLRRWEKCGIEEWIIFFLHGRSSTCFIINVLCCIWKSSSLDSTDFSFCCVLILYDIGIYIGILGCWGIFDIVRQLNTFMVMTLIAVFCNFSISLGIKVFWFDSRYVANISRYVWIGNVRCFLSLLRFWARNIAHIADNWVLFGLCIEHEVIK